MSDNTRYLRFTAAASNELEQAEKSFDPIGPRGAYHLRRAEIWAELARAAAECND